MPQQSNQDLLVANNDYIYSNQDFDSSPIVLEDYKLVFFPIEGNEGATWRRLFRRMLGAEDWKDTTKQFQGLTYLSDFDQDKATEIMTSPEYTRAMIVQDPKTRLLSIYISKVVKDPTEQEFMKTTCCGDKRQLIVPGSEGHHGACAEQKEPVSFELFVELVNECDQPYWRPQSRRMEPKYYKYINFVGHYERIKKDAMELLQKCGAWEKYGRNGWGDDGTKSIFETSSTWTVTSSIQLYPQNYTESLETITKERCVWCWLGCPARGTSTT
jgi:hypothetical protein